jgi:uncharacterized protein YnzC (UPF0291/DUF896 family)
MAIVTEADILQRLIEADEGEMSPETARYILALTLPRCDQQRMDQLSDKARLERLTAEEQAALAAYRRVVDFVERLREKARAVLESNTAVKGPSHDVVEIPAGIRRSQEAFWRDLSELLKSGNRGKWVAYHGDERTGIGSTKTELIRDILGRGISRDNYFVGLIHPHELPPWETEEIEPIHPRHLESVPPSQ